ncbi:MAG: hypothetical protein ABJK39_08165 [Hyphomicrobiales bacterium]
MLGLLAELEKRGISVSHSNLQGVGENATFDEIRLSSGKANAPQFVFASGNVVKATESVGVGLDADSFTAKEFRIENGDKVISFANFQVQDFSLPNMELLLDAPDVKDDTAKLVDPLGILNGTFYKFLAGTKFSLFSVDSAEAVIEIDNSKGVFSTGPLALESMQDGTLASYAINGLNFSVTDENKDDVKFSIEKILVNDYNIATLAHVFSEANYKDGKGDGQWRDAAGVGTISNVEFLVDGGTVKIAKITNGASRLRQLDIAPIEAMRVLQGVEEVQQSRDFPIEKFRELAPVMSSFYRMMELDEMRIEGLVVTPPNQSIPFKLGTILVDRYSVDQGLKEVSIADLSFADKDGLSINLGRFALGDIQFPELAGIMTYLDGLTSESPPEPSYAAIAALSPTLGEIDIKSFTGLFGREGTIKLDGATLTASDYIRLIPTKLSLNLDNVVAPLEDLPRSNDVAKFLVEMGYKEAVLNGVIDMVWTEATQELEILPSKVRINDMGVLSLSAKVGNVPRQFVEDPEKGAAFAAGVTFKEAEISFEDQSITNRFIEMTAKKSAGGDTAAVRQQFGALAKGPLAILQKPDFAAKVGTIVDNFLANPGKVTITARPAQPLPLAGFAIIAEQAPGNFVDALNLQVSGP